MNKSETIGYVVCVRNTGNEISLHLRKVYPVISPEPNDPTGWVRVIDETGEDYLFPADDFVPVDLSPAAANAVESAQETISN